MCQNPAACRAAAVRQPGLHPHLVRATALVNCGEGFTQPEKVVDGFSDTCMKILQERGYHTRTIMGTHNMPNHNNPR